MVQYLLTDDFEKFIIARTKLIYEYMCKITSIDSTTDDTSNIEN